MSYRPPRQEYRRAALRLTDLDADPFTQFRRWLDEAVETGVPEPTAMTLATADPTGRPSARTVLLKGLDAHGFVFFTNLDSRKGRELDANPRAALVFRWQELERQVSVAGDVAAVTDAEADAYFDSRPRDSQLAAWASPQSRVVSGREEIERWFSEAASVHREGPVPRPPRWSGFRVLPAEIEFWQGRPARLHDRIRYRPAGSEASGKALWVRERLAP